MTCESCQEKVKQILSGIKGIAGASISWQKGEAILTMHEHVPTSVLQEALKPTRYQLSETIARVMPETISYETSWLQTYKPVLLIFAYLFLITFLVQAGAEFSWMLWMNHFMAGFFLVFSFFKLLNLEGFAGNYATYDIIAKHWRFYAYIYAFIELGLGLLFLTGVYPVFTNVFTLVVMSVSLVGVLQTVLNKRKIRCACLGDVFNLPMSTITVIEDGLMITMAAVMLAWMYMQ